MEVRDLSYSDCYQRSIACSRKGFTRHCRDAILPKSHNPHTFLPNEKTALDTRFLHFWWKCEGICSKRSLRNSKRANLFAKRSVSPKYGVHVAEQRHDEIVQNPRVKSIKKQVEQGSTCLFCGGSVGFALQRLLPKVNRVQPKGVHTALP